jgi:hypothetical protein
MAKGKAAVSPKNLAHKKRQADEIGPAYKFMKVSDLDLWEGLAQADDAVAFFPGSTLLQQLNPLEAFEDVTFDDEAAGTLETLVLGHGVIGESGSCDALKGKGARVRLGP